MTSTYRYHTTLSTENVLVSRKHIWVMVPNFAIWEQYNFYSTDIECILNDSAFTFHSETCMQSNIFFILMTTLL